ncbi:hypothetical protein [Streptomyces sp. NPDC005262]|uniref:hypothetical protein n=1 Tax=Streptomyces sp. NPDC005262 TaxID=3364710 RepID=UPI0036890A2F
MESRDGAALQEFWKEQGCDGVDAVVTTMQVVGCGLAQAQEMFFAAPCRAAELDFHNAVMDSCEEVSELLPVVAVGREGRGSSGTERLALLLLLPTEAEARQAALLLLLPTEAKARQAALLLLLPASLLLLPHKGARQAALLLLLSALLLLLRREARQAAPLLLLLTRETRLVDGRWRCLRGGRCRHSGWG